MLLASALLDYCWVSKQELRTKFLPGEDLYFLNDVFEATKRYNTRPMFIAGGQEASMNYTTLFDTLTWLDACICGLGEPVMQTLVSRLLTGSKSTISAIPGFVTRKSSAASIEEIMPKCSVPFSQLSQLIHV